MHDLPSSFFPQFFPQFTMCRNVSFGVKLYQIALNTWPDRVRPKSITALLKYMNTHTNDLTGPTVDIQALRLIFNLGRTSMHQLTKDPSFPQAYVISARHHLWDRAEVMAWLDSRKLKTVKARKTIKAAPKDEVIGGIVFAKRVA